MSYVKFEMSHSQEEGIEPISLARRIYERGNAALRESGEKEERILLLEAWREMEKVHGDEESHKKVEAKLPRRVRRRQAVIAADGVSKVEYIIINNKLFIYYMRKSLKNFILQANCSL